MRVLVVAATEAELAPLKQGSHARRGIDFVATGVGMVATAARVSRALAVDTYDAALNIGLCGSFNAACEPGSVVHVVSDRLAELGAEDGDAFLPLAALGLPGEDLFVNTRPPKSAALARLPQVSGITVNTVHGREASIASVRARYNPDVETMEGAAFMCACEVGRTIYAQVRAVSNRVERRNRAAWTIDAALDALTAAAAAILDDL